MNNFLAKIWHSLSIPKRWQLLIMSFLQDRFLVGVTGVIFNAENKILLVRHTYRGDGWSLPGGYIKSKEHPAEGLEREIKEETGLVVSADEEVKTRTDREAARLDICYFGTFIGGSFQPSSEVKEYGLFLFEDLPIVPRNQLLLIKEAIDQKK